jgi:ribose 1,5-bisphosphokinase PhnN
VRCFYFDSIGVPTADAMEREHGGGEKWQATATADWLARLNDLSEDVLVAVLDGQTRPSFVLSAGARIAPGNVRVVLLDCSSDVRAMRLRCGREQPELANARADRWAAYLRGQADALELTVIDTTLLTVTAASEQLEEIVRQLIESDTSAA